MRSILVACLWVSFGLVLACAPVTSSRIGPPVLAKSDDCEIELLPEGETPDRPYRDVGVVSLKNCQDHTTGPCKKWLTSEACKLGGDVAYGAVDPMRDGRPDDLGGVVTVSVTIGAYVNHTVPSDDDPVLNATSGGSCADTETDSNDAEDPEDQMCTE